MNSFRGLLFGVALLALLGWAGVLAVPWVQLEGLAPFVDPDTGQAFPKPPNGLARRGSMVYAENGCAYCHTQQVRGSHQGGDLVRGWGSRRSVARDYIYETTPALGFMRIGPDLANEGAPRIEKITTTGPDGKPVVTENAILDKDAAWHHRHLYNPRSLRLWSLMPAFRNLYRTEKITGSPSPDALQLTGSDAPAPGYQVLPTPDAEALVAYLLSLNQSYKLPEAGRP